MEGTDGLGWWADIPTGTYVGVQREVQVPPELLNGAATPVLKHMQVGMSPELHRGEGTMSEQQWPVLSSGAEQAGGLSVPCIFYGRLGSQPMVLLGDGRTFRRWGT